MDRNGIAPRHGDGKQTSERGEEKTRAWTVEFETGTFEGKPALRGGRFTRLVSHGVDLGGKVILLDSQKNKLSRFQR